MNKTLVTDINLMATVSHLESCKVLASDTETFGLKAADKLFSLMICTGDEVFYFNFLDYSENGQELGNPHVLDKQQTFNSLKKVFNDESKTWVFHNAPFDLYRLWLEGASIKGKVWDTACAARIVYNQHLKYSLDACLKRIGLEKDDAVEKYISKNKLYTWETQEGKKARNKLKHYDKVPFDIMHDYGCMDAYGTYKLYESQVDEIAPD